MRYARDSDETNGTARESETALWTSRVGGEGSVSEAVVSALAAAKDIDRTEVGTVLYDRIDPDALDALFASRADGTTRDGGRVSFPAGDYEVQVRKDDEYVVEIRSTGVSGTTRA